MADDPPIHEFDAGAALEYRPRSSFTKTAILFEPADPDAITVIRAPFGEQTMRGAFYVVAEGQASYGAARHEFESSHEEIAPNRWVKQDAVLAYRASAWCRVETHVGEVHEGTAIARPGDWIVRQRTGEEMVVKPEEFAARYVEAGHD